MASTGLPLTILPGSTLTLYLYAHGIVPSDSNLPTASPSASASASATASPIPSPTAVPTYTGVMTLAPTGCIAFGNVGGTQTFTASLTTSAPPGTQLYYIWSNPSGQPFHLYVPLNAGEHRHRSERRDRDHDEQRNDHRSNVPGGHACR